MGSKLHEFGSAVKGQMLSSQKYRDDLRVVDGVLIGSYEIGWGRENVGHLDFLRQLSLRCGTVSPGEVEF